ncbi:MAG: class II aldolase/adducin family protein [Pseudomonadota bacterium]
MTAPRDRSRRRRGELSVREQIVALCRQMNAAGLNQGTSGNISVRFREDMLITPSGLPYEAMGPDDIACMPVAGDTLEWAGPHRPSSEWHFHRAILRTRPEFGAVVHTHSTFATTLAIGGESIPPCHYMVAAFGGRDVRCARYATFGTDALSEQVLIAMRERSACLLANHGMVAAGADLERAMWSAVELETLARQYYYAKLADKVVLLADDEIDRVIEKFKGYGPKSNTDR